LNAILKTYYISSLRVPEKLLTYFSKWNSTQ